MSEQLKPCPFCGGKAVSDTLQNESTVQCVNPDCDVIANVSGFGCDVDIDIWNTRPIEDQLSARIADLEQELDEAKRHNLRQRVEDIFGIGVRSEMTELDYDHLLILTDRFGFSDDLTEDFLAYYMSIESRGETIYDVIDWLIEQGVEDE